MADSDLRISELRDLGKTELRANDWLAVADRSASETKKITTQNFLEAAAALIAEDTIPSAKLLFGEQDIPGGALVNGAVDTLQLASGAVEASKLADNSSVNLDTSLPATGAYRGQIGIDTGTYKASVWDGSTWQPFRAGASINTVATSTTGPLTFSVSTVSDTATINAQITDAAAASQFLAGPTDVAGGAVQLRTITSADLPLATSAAKGAVQVNGFGLAMFGNRIVIDNEVAAEETNYHVVQYDDNGLITAGRQITGADLPIAAAGTVGVVYPGAGLSVDTAGEIAHTNSVTAGSAAKVSFDAQGHITGTFSLDADDIPDIPATKLTSGTLATNVIPTNGINGGNLADYSVTQFGGPGSTAGITVYPTAQYIGQFFWDENRKDLYIWSGASWLPVTITSGELIFAGTYNASTNEIASLTAAGTAISAFTVGDSLPAADAGNNQYYFVVVANGTGSGNAPAVALEAPDQILSDGGAWRLIDVSSTVVGQTASNVTYTPTGDITGATVQLAIDELDTEKLGKAGGTVTGEIVVNSPGGVTINSGYLRFEGSTADDYETTLTVVDPTADRTITLPNVTGTVVTTGDNGTVSNTMLAGSITYAKLSISGSIKGSDISAVSGDAIPYGKLNLGTSIKNADIAADAAIAYTKLNLGTSLVNADIATNAAIAYSKLDLEASIDNDDIALAANIADSKLATISTAGKVSGNAITSGTIAGATAINTSGNITTTGTVTDAAGSIRRIPQNAKTAAYTLIATDVGKHISITTGGVTVPGSVFAVGDNVTIFNNSTSNQTITQGAGVTLRAGGSTATGNRTLANYGVATILCVATDVFVITGTGIT